MILVDTSALAKLLVEEAESRALRADFSRRRSTGEEFAISTIATVELRRFAIRLNFEPAQAEAVIRRFRILKLTESILQLAGRLPYQHLGTLDATHLATALAAEADALVTYDARQSKAARSEGLKVVRPAA